MEKKFYLIVSLILLVALNCFPAQLKHGKDNTIESGIYDDDYLFSGEELSFTGSCKNLFFVGESLDFNGKTKSSLNGIGENLVINGEIGNNLITAGSNIEINCKLNSTGFFSGKDIIIKKDSIINSDVFILGRNIRVEGTINGDLYVLAGRLIINGPINGDVKVNAGKIIINGDGIITGNLSYRTERELSKSEQSKIKGQIKYRLPENMDKYRKICGFNKGKFIKNLMIIKFVFLLLILVSFIIAGLLFLLFPLMKKLENQKTKRNFWFILLWGLIPFFIYPVIPILFIILGITFPLAFILFFASLPVLFISQILGVTLTGQFLFNLFKWNTHNRFLYFLFGVIFFIILNIIPVINILSIIFFSSIGWGLILEGLFNKKFE